MSYRKRVAIFLTIMALSAIALISAFAWQLGFNRGAGESFHWFTDEFVEEVNTQDR